jgi:cytochrome c oxidase subunit 1
MATATATHAHEPDYLNAKQGIGSWIYTVDHKRLGMMYLASILLFFAMGGFFACWCASSC